MTPGSARPGSPAQPEVEGCRVSSTRTKLRHTHLTRLTIADLHPVVHITMHNMWHPAVNHTQHVVPASRRALWLCPKHRTKTKTVTGRPTCSAVGFISSPDLAVPPVPVRARARKRALAMATGSHAEILAEAQAAFLAASAAVWREIDRLDTEPDGYHPVRMSVELRQREREAWDRYRDALDGGHGD